MALWARLWNDERGYVVSAELITLCTLGVIGGVVGLNVASKAVNEELMDVAFALRSLDQSYCVEGRSACGAWTAGSCFQQEPVEVSLQKLRESAKEQEKELDKARSEASEGNGPESENAAPPVQRDDHRTPAAQTGWSL